MLQALGTGWSSCCWRRAAPQIMALLPTLDKLTRELDTLMFQDVDLAVFEVVRIGSDKLSRYGALHSLHTACVVWLVARRKVGGRQAAERFEGRTDDEHRGDGPANHAGPEAARWKSCSASACNHPLDGMYMLKGLGWSTRIGWTPWPSTTSNRTGRATRRADQGDGAGRRAAHLRCLLRQMSPRVGRPAMLSPTAAVSIFGSRARTSSARRW